MPHKVIMPALGMAQETGKLIGWLKQPGDRVITGDALMEVETDKATMQVEALESGFLTDVGAQAGDEIPVGQIVALISETPGSHPTSVTPAEPPAPSPSHETDSDDGLPDGHRIIMPALGMAQDTGLIVAWRKAPGDAVAAQDILLDVETDKSVMEVEAGHDGFVAAMLADAREPVPVGSIIAIISEDKPVNPFARGLSHTASRSTSESAPTPPTEEPVKSTAARVAGAAPANGDRILASPKARRLAIELGLDLALLVDQGVEQPYHVADLERLKTLEKKPISDASALAAGHGAPPMHIAAEVPARGCDDLIAWLAKNGEIEIEPRLIWLRVATAAFRQATGDGGRSIFVEIRVLREPAERFVDADRSPLSSPAVDDGDQLPDLVLRDLSSSPIIAATMNAGNAPVFSIGRRGEAYLLSLDYTEHQLSEDQAMAFVTEVAARLARPLGYIV